MDKTPLHINLQLLDELSPERQQILVDVLNRLIPVGLDVGVTSLSAIVVAKQHRLPELVNAVLKQVGSDRRYSPGEHAADGLALPAEQDGQLTSLIFLSTDLIERSHDAEDAELMTTVLEELLHVEVYALTHKHQQTLSPHIGGQLSTNWLFPLCSTLHDEYIVIRRKITILADGEFAYGSPIAPILDRTATDLSKVLHDASIAHISDYDAWGQVLNLIYRGIFEPLARNEAYCTKGPSQRFPKNSPDDSHFYQENVSAYWQHMKVALERSYNSDLEDVYPAKLAIMHALVDFLQHIGVTFSETKDGVAWVRFAARFFTH